MTTAPLEFAKLFYGKAGYDVAKHPGFPQEFDFDDAENCARRAFAMLSRASGCFPLRDCRMALDVERRTASLVANGAHAFYAPPNRPKMSLDEAIAATHRTQRTNFGTCVASQGDHDDWQSATWVAPDA